MKPAPGEEVEFETLIGGEWRSAIGTVQPMPYESNRFLNIRYEVGDRIQETLVPLERLAGHQKDDSRIQLSLFDQPEPELPEKRVLGGQVNHACGWIENHPVKRTRKSGATWEGEQSWLHWQEGEKKRSRYIPKGKLELIQESVYELRNPVSETVKLLEQK